MNQFGSLGSEMGDDELITDEEFQKKEISMVDIRYMQQLHNVIK